jgi:hypothetical protein
MQDRPDQHKWYRRLVYDPRHAPDQINVDGVVHYHGVTVDGEYTVHGVIPGQPPIDRTMPVTDFYLGHATLSERGLAEKEAAAF